MSNFVHSVALDKDKCKGCINCIKRCPTEAIRVRNGKARIISERCIDCGECIRVCPNHAKLALYDPLSVLERYEYTVALPAPALYGQFHNLDEIDIILEGLLNIGFDDVFPVASAAELVSDATRKLMASGKLKRPVISSACPAVTRLIRVRFPELIENILPLRAPVEVAAGLAKQRAMEKTGLPADKIGVIFISPCPAKRTAARMPLVMETSAIDAVVAIKEVYPKLLAVMRPQDDSDDGLNDSGRIGVGWGSSGGEAAALLKESYLAADGIENVIKVLEDLEDEKLGELDFIELNACAAGCVGGVLTVENPYIARTRLKKLRKYLPVACNRLGDSIPEDMGFQNELEPMPIMQFDNDIRKSMEIMRSVSSFLATLPGLDCGSCGAPSCRAFAEDVVTGFATESDCVFKYRDQLKSTGEGTYLPPPFRTPEKPGNDAT